MAEDAVVSCLCVTEGRPEFMSWLLWGFDRQTYPHKELVVIDSSPKPLATSRADVRVLAMPPGTNVPTKRNAALTAAAGSIVAWFDDDDWQHPDRLRRLVEALADGAPYAGGSRSWFVDLQTQQCQPYDGRRAMIFNGAGFRAEVARGVPFHETVRKASDTVWMRDLRRKVGSPGKALGPDPLTVWLCHESNISNPRTRRRFGMELRQLKDQIGDAWAGTDEKLAELRDSLRFDTSLPQRQLAVPRWVEAPALRGRQRYGLHHRGALRLGGEAEDGSVEEAAAVGDAPLRALSIPQLPEASAAPVTLVVRIDATDDDCIPLLDVHLKLQAATRWTERLVVVEPCSDAERLSAARRALGELVAHGRVDRVLVPPYEAIDSMLPYFPGAVAPPHQALSNRALAELLGVATARTDHVLLTGSRVLSYAPNRSWVVPALAKMRADPSLWLMTTHSGPPVGPVGSLRTKGRDARRWDRRLGIWRSRQSPGEYCLLDRRKLLGALALGQAAPSLSDWIAAAMVTARGYHGILGGAESWSVQIQGRLPMQDWAERLGALISQGHCPPCQRGHYLADLDEPVSRFAWGELARGERESQVASQ